MLRSSEQKLLGQQLYEAISLPTSTFGHGAAWSFLAGDRTRPSTRMSIPAGGPSIKTTALEKGA